MKARDIGTREVHCAAPDANLGEVASMMKRHGVGAMPICEGDTLTGIITDRDIAVGCVAAGSAPADCQAREFMTSNPITVSADTDVEEAARIMAREQVRRLPVVEGDRMVGILSLGDIAAALPDNENLVADTLRKVSTPTQVARPL